MLVENQEEELAQANLGMAKSLSQKVNKGSLNFAEDLKQVTQIYTSGPICLNDGNKLITANTIMKGEVGSFNFDESLNVDQSGNKNILLGNIKRGFGINGLGISALLNGKDPLMLKNLPLYNSKTFTYTFWVYLHEYQLEKAYCPLIWKGQEDLPEKKFDRSPAILVNAKNGKIKAYVTVTKKDGAPLPEPTPGLTAETLGSIQPNKWTFIALTVSETSIRIYLNGVLDAIQSMENMKPLINNNDIFIGGVPQITNSNSVNQKV